MPDQPPDPTSQDKLQVKSGRRCTKDDPRVPWLCSCDTCSREAAHVWSSYMDSVHRGDITLEQAQRLADLNPTLGGQPDVRSRVMTAADRAAEIVAGRYRDCVESDDMEAIAAIHGDMRALDDAGLLVTDEMRAVLDAAVALKSLPVGSQDYTDRSITLGVAVRTYLATLPERGGTSKAEECAHNASGEGSSPSRRTDVDDWLQP